MRRHFELQRLHGGLHLRRLLLLLLEPLLQHFWCDLRLVEVKLLQGGDNLLIVACVRILRV